MIWKKKVDGHAMLSKLLEQSVEEKKARPYNTTAEWTPFAACEICCKYKITTLAHCHFNGSLPSYLSASLCTYQTSRTLRSSNKKLLKITTFSLNSVGHHSFSFIAPTVWNSLPASLQNLPTLSDFKAQLKTFLFQQAFPHMCVCVLSLCLCVYLHE